MATTHGGSSDHYQRAPRGASLGDSKAPQRGHEQEKTKAKIKNRIAESWHPVPSQPLPVESALRRHLFLLHMPSDERRWEQNHANMDEVTHLFTSCPLGKPESFSRWALFSTLHYLIADILCFRILRSSSPPPFFFRSTALRRRITVVRYSLENVPTVVTIHHVILTLYVDFLGEDLMSVSSSASPYVGITFRWAFIRRRSCPLGIHAAAPPRRCCLALLNMASSLEDTHLYAWSLGSP